MTRASRGLDLPRGSEARRDARREGTAMKLIRIGRSALVTLVTASLLALSATSAGAFERDVHTDPGAEMSSPVTFDLLFLRPVGLVSLVTGTALFIAPVMPLTLISRPGDIGKPAKVLVARPARYVFADPLGQH